MTRTFCDNCKDEVHPSKLDRVCLAKRHFGVSNQLKDLIRITTEKDFCNTCLVRLEKFFNGEIK